MSASEFELPLPAGAPRKKPRRRAIASLDIESALAELQGAKVDALRERWQVWLAEEPPPCQSGRVLRLLLAARLQEARFGGLSSVARRHLRDVANPRRSGKSVTPGPLALKRGVVLVREWKGVVHRVHVLDRGFAHEGVVYESLSEAARVITGTRWSGPRFFGLNSPAHQQAPPALPPSSGARS